AGCWLVQHQHFRMHSQNACYSHAAFLASGQFKGGLLIVLLRESHKIQRPSGVLVTFLLGQSLIFRAETYVSDNVHLKKLVLWILKHQSYLPSQLSHIIAFFVYTAAVIVNCP